VQSSFQYFIRDAGQKKYQDAIKAITKDTLFMVVCSMLNIIVVEHGTAPAGNGSM